MPGIITQLPYWNPDSDKILEPADAKQDTGWLAGEAVPYNWLNWFFKYTYEGVKTLNDNAFLNTAGINEVIEDTLANRPDAVNQQELDMFIAQDTKEIYQVIGGSWARVAGSIAEQIGYSGSLDSSDVKAALDELDTEKLAKSSGYSTIDTVANLIDYINNNADVPNADYADNAGQVDGIEASQFVRIDQDNSINGKLTVGDISTDSESSEQSSSSFAGDDFLVTPWVYTGAIEASGERGASSTLIEIGANNLTGADEIALITNGTISLLADINNNISIPNGTLSVQGTEVATINDVVPPGAVFWRASATVPNGYLKCDGAAVSKSTYQDLYNVIGDQFGSTGSTSTFALPDLRDEFVRGAGGNRNVGDWENYQIENITGHVSSSRDLRATSTSGGFSSLNNSGEYGAGNSANDLGFDFDASRVVNAGSETRPRNVALMPIIKY